MIYLSCLSSALSGAVVGIVSLLERAQASSIAKFSHSISFRLFWLWAVLSHRYDSALVIPMSGTEPHL